ncbi:MAG: Hsp70 family protein [Deltaproteobacteria bacterium]|nr:Hsp70 family protein [Deltaproteobacteria bacterium]
MRDTLEFGIDLGTTNSSIAWLDGIRPVVVKSADESEVTPSVVRIDGKGVITVGRKAKQHLEIDPSNTRGEFKRLMGTAEAFDFEKSGQRHTPESLSAEVLKVLRADARDRLGMEVDAAVITVPALFELPQCEATRRAAALAGLGSAPLLQEPVASAIACGFTSGAATDGHWLVYDLGGGTFDTSLMRAREGRMSVVDHDGDNFLGGKDFDWKLVAHVLEEIKKRYALPALTRGNPKYLRAVARLKAACEEAKIELSRKERTTLCLPELCPDADGTPVDVDLELTRGGYEQLILPAVQRTVEICRSLLARQGLGPGSLEKLIFVGGPTLTPLVRSAVEDALGVKAEQRVDPMTIVAQGAAIFAGTVRREQPAAGTAPKSSCVLQLEYPSIAQDTEPYVVGKVVKQPEPPVAFVELSREDGGWSSGRVPLNEKGGFVISVVLKERAANPFAVKATDVAGNPVAVTPAALGITHGMAVSDPPLSRTLGVALANNVVAIYVAKGTPLPARRTYVHRTVEPLRPGTDEVLLCIPVVQGESLRADRNRMIGTLHIPARNLKRPLPARSEVEVTLEVDRSGGVRAQAFVPLLDTVFEQVVSIATPKADPAHLREAVARERDRLGALRTRAYQAHQPATIERLARADSLLTNLEEQLEAAGAGDADAAQQAWRGLLDLQLLLDEGDQALAWPELESDAVGALAAARGWVIGEGGETERKHFQRLESELEAALKERRAELVEDKANELRLLSSRLALRQDWVWRSEFETLAADVGSLNDLPRAQELVEKGRRALSEDRMDELKALVRKLWELSPVEREERLKSFNSGLR